MPYRSGKNSTRLFVLLFLGVLLSALAFSWLLLSSSLFIPHPSATQVLSGDPKPIMIPQLTPPKSSQPPSEQTEEVVQDVIKEVARAIAPTEAGLAVPPANQPVDQLAAIPSPPTRTEEVAPEGILGKKATAEPEATPKTTSEAENALPTVSSQSDTLQASPETTIAVTAGLTTEPESEKTATERGLANNIESIPEQAELVPEPEQTEPAPEPASIAETLPPELSTDIALVETQVAPEPSPTTEPASLALATTVPANTGWIYAGQFSNGQWITSGLQLDKNTEPATGESYKLTWGANVRAAPPGQRSSTDDPVKLAETIATIPVGNEIKVVQVKYSGKNGHIWLEIAY